MGAHTPPEQAAAGTAPRPVLVGGCPRSGTTLLRTMLDSHPELAVPHETQFVVRAWRRRDRFGDLSRPGNRRDAARWILDLPNSRFSRIGIPREDLVEAFAAAPPTLGSLMATCFSLYAERDGKPRWGDKRPSYARNLTVVFGLFPDARFVHVVRDPRACAASMRRTWPKWGRLASAVDVWERTDKAVQAALRRLPSEQILQIRYEDLVTNEQATLDRVCAFLALDPARVPDMLAYHTGDNLPRGKLHENTSKPVTTEALQRWRSELDAAEVALIERTLGSRLRHHGYQPTGTGAEVPRAVLAELKDVRNRRDREERRVRLTELRLRITQRRPTAALTLPAR